MLHSNFHKMAEKLNFMIFRDLFLNGKHILPRRYLISGNSFYSIIRRKKTEHFKTIKKSIMAAQKCKNVWLKVVLKEFLSTRPKLKK